MKEHYTRWDLFRDTCYPTDAKCQKKSADAINTTVLMDRKAVLLPTKTTVAST